VALVRPGAACLVLCLAFGCSPPVIRGGSDLIQAGLNVPLLPDGSPGPEPCPSNAKDVMKALRLRPGDTARIEIDANQIHREPLTVNDGPVESIMMEPMGQLEGASRLYGRVWTSGPRVVIRYYRAQMAGAEVIPICAVARKGYGQLEGKPGRFPKSAELQFSTALAFIVEDFL
jgi:hypothetical protein